MKAPVKKNIPCAICHIYFRPKTVHDTDVRVCRACLHDSITLRGMIAAQQPLSVLIGNVGKQYRAVYQKRYTITDLKPGDIVAVTSPHTFVFFIGKILEVWIGRDTFTLHPIGRHDFLGIPNQATHNCDPDSIDCRFKCTDSSN